MTSAEYDGNGRLFHSRNHLGNCKTCLNISANCINQHKQSVNSFVLLNRNKQRDDMLVFCGFVLLRKNVMTFNLTDNRQAMQHTVLMSCENRTCFADSVCLFFTYGAVVCKLLRIIIRHRIFNIVPFF